MIADRHAYCAMYLFLDNIWKQKKGEFNDDFPVLLGAMVIVDNVRTLDPAQWLYWKDCVAQKNELTEQEGFNAMMTFLDNYRKRGEGEAREITKVINLIRTSPIPAWETWMKYVQIVSSKVD